jgi:hypothetical protein
LVTLSNTIIGPPACRWSGAAPFPSTGSAAEEGEGVWAG